MLKPTEILQQLSESRIYRDYEAAFSDATRLPLALRPHEIWRHAMEGKKNQNPFCLLLAQSSRSCAACLEVQQKMTDGAQAGEKSATVTCFAGLSDTAVPLRVGTEVIGFLQTGQVALGKPSRAGFSRVCRQLIEWGVEVDLRRLEDAYFHGKVLSPEQYGAMIRLLEIFAQHLSAFANQLLIRKTQEESPMVTKAKRLIADRSGDDLSLDEMAKALNVSTFYFCKLFRKATGLTFTEYLSRTRVEKARNLLVNPNLRVSEIAFECGFGSLGHFNRVFRKIAGASPSAYRERLLKPAPAKAAKAAKSKVPAGR
ncbi:AraC-type DNA-binding protein [Verrucomicrobium sp. GAS474]|uniref:helix-turn-helix domain-containing protein n=1 Tax=Verrucomicrobium sp. GAS474 TaxID=1882831 RepID=UPI000879478D|nr:helix-turn-helix domain-containing protein [Verrucomicrobium sp. GAS474]SDU00329.1 AraC-type DNA-binding protein [Verrucomicrobium sp. GAS474]